MRLKQYVKALNDFIHTWMYAYKNIELKYVRFEGEDTGDGVRKYPDLDFLYIIWADGTQSRIYISESSEREILKDFLNKEYEDVPEDEYI
jgi:hypothetical protein